MNNSDDIEMTGNDHWKSIVESCKEYDKAGDQLESVNWS